MRNEFINLQEYKIPKEVTDLISCEVALCYISIPIQRDGNILTCVMVDPLNKACVDYMGYITGCTINPVGASELEILEAIGRHYVMSRKYRMYRYPHHCDCYVNGASIEYYPLLLLHGLLIAADKFCPSVQN